MSRFNPIRPALLLMGNNILPTHLKPLLGPFSRIIPGRDNIRQVLWHLIGPFGGDRLHYFVKEQAVSFRREMQPLIDISVSHYDRPCYFSRTVMQEFFEGLVLRQSHPPG